METIQEKLRRVADTLRIKSIPLKDIIPLLQESADKFDQLENRLDTLEMELHQHKYFNS